MDENVESNGFQSEEGWGKDSDWSKGQEGWAATEGEPIDGSVLIAEGEDMGLYFTIPPYGVVTIDHTTLKVVNRLQWRFRLKNLLPGTRTRRYNRTHTVSGTRYLVSFHCFSTRKVFRKMKINLTSKTKAL